MEEELIVFRTLSSPFALRMVWTLKIKGMEYGTILEDVSNKEFQEGQRVLMYDTRLHIFLGKLKSRWIGPFIIHRVYSNGVVELIRLMVA